MKNIAVTVTTLRMTGSRPDHASSIMTGTHHAKEIMMTSVDTATESETFRLAVETKMIIVMMIVGLNVRMRERRTSNAIVNGETKTMMMMTLLITTSITVVVQRSLEWVLPVLLHSASKKLTIDVVVMEVKMKVINTEERNPVIEVTYCDVQSQEMSASEMTGPKMSDPKTNDLEMNDLEMNDQKMADPRNEREMSMILMVRHPNDESVIHLMEIEDQGITSKRMIPTLRMRENQNHVVLRFQMLMKNIEDVCSKKLNALRILEVMSIITTLTTNMIETSQSVALFPLQLVIHEKKEPKATATKQLRQPLIREQEG